MEERKNPSVGTEALRSVIHTGSLSERVVGASRLAGSFVFWEKSMARNLKRYYQAWELRQQRKTFKEIEDIMKISRGRANQLVHFIEGKIKYKKPLSDELKELIKKYH